MTWNLIADTADTYTIRCDGVDVGTFSLLPTAPTSGRLLFPSVRAGLIASVFNDFDANVNTQVRHDIEQIHRTAGWPSAAVYHEEIEAIKTLTGDLDPATRERLAAAWAAHAWPQPLTPEQMVIWQNEILDIATTPTTEVAA